MQFFTLLPVVITENYQVI